MKSSNQSGKSVHSNTGTKSKKNSRDKDKRKFTNVNAENNIHEKGSPSKESRRYAGISHDTIFNYAEQTTCEHLSEEVTNLLTEDINYKLRHIIYDALLKARLNGRDVIYSSDIDETFRNLSIEKVYGAPANPTWVPFGDQNLLYLDDVKINLVELAEEESIYAQYGDVTLTKKWYPNTEPSQALKNYFIALCCSVISNDPNLRLQALKDISSNPLIGSIIEWFYHFSYFLLMKDITYDSLTLYALDLLETLEGSPLGRSNVSAKQLKLLVRLLLQRLLISKTSPDVLKPMCSVLGVLCLRDCLKEMVITKINQKLGSAGADVMFPVLSTIYFLGFDAIKAIFIPNTCYFLNMHDVPEIRNVLLCIYAAICKSEPNDTYVQSLFYEKFGEHLTPFLRPISFTVQEIRTEPINFIAMKTQLIKTRRKVDVNFRKHTGTTLEDVFDIPSKDCKVRRTINTFREGLGTFRRETRVVIGKTSLLLSVFKVKCKTRSVNDEVCLNHTLINYIL